MTQPNLPIIPPPPPVAPLPLPIVMPLPPPVGAPVIVPPPPPVSAPTPPPPLVVHHFVESVSPPTATATILPVPPPAPVANGTVVLLTETDDVDEFANEDDGEATQAGYPIIPITPFYAVQFTKDTYVCLYTRHQAVEDEYNPINKSLIRKAGEWAKWKLAAPFKFPSSFDAALVRIIDLSLRDEAKTQTITTAQGLLQALDKVKNDVAPGAVKARAQKPAPKPPKPEPKKKGKK